MNTLTLDDDSSDIDQEIIERLIKIFDEKNQIVKAFRMTRDHFELSQSSSVHLKLLRRCDGDSLQYNVLGGCLARTLPLKIFSILRDTVGRKKK